MKSKKFPVGEYLPTNKANIESDLEHNSELNKSDQRPKCLINCKCEISDVELVVIQIEGQQIDLTSDYTDWCNIGFGFADSLGEEGRDFFHRVSKFHEHYNHEECEKQYNNCLNSKGSGVTVGTFFHMAKERGIQIKILMKSEENSNKSITPTLPNDLYSNLPKLLQETSALFKDGTEKDVYLIGALGVLSGCLPNIHGIYFDEPITTHIYTFIVAPAGSGKGKMKWAKYLGQLIHDSFINCSKEEKELFNYKMDEYNNMSKVERKTAEKPMEPAQRMFYIPANCSSSAFIQALADNEFNGVIFESEADTLTGTFKQEWGNFSDVLRKAFHHESTSMFRRKDNEFIEIEDPHLAIVLSGTPKQVSSMMPDTENGLFSRFLYYFFEDDSEFKNPFTNHSEINYTEFFVQKGRSVFDLYEQLNNLSKPIVFQLTQEQAYKFTSSFSAMLDRTKCLIGRDLDANCKRLGLITFRIAMILSVLRILEDGECPEELLCSNIDFDVALSIATTLDKHAIAIYQDQPNNAFKGLKNSFFEVLPDEFNRQIYLKASAELEIKPKTAEKYISDFCKKGLLSHDHNKYVKITK